MIRPLRRRHRRIWWLLAVALPLALATAIWIRPSSLRSDLPATGPLAPADPSPSSGPAAR